MVELAGHRDAFVVGAGAGPAHVVGCNSEVSINNYRTPPTIVYYFVNEFCFFQMIVNAKVGNEGETIDSRTCRIHKSNVMTFAVITFAVLNLCVFSGQRLLSRKASSFRVLSFMQSVYI